MNYKSVVVILIAIGVFACGNDDHIRPNLINGAYVGTFERQNNASNVILNFQNGQFTGESDTTKFPAICNGNYQISKNSITFENLCPWTAEFDWTLILSGMWNFQISGEELILTNSAGDKYTLTKQ